MKLTAPKLDDRPAQPYIGIRGQVPIGSLEKLIPASLTELFAWLDRQDIAPAGPPFIRFHVVDMAALMDVELGVPVAAAVEGDDRVHPGVLPAGRYGSLIYTGVSNGVKANAALLDWAAQQGIVWDRWDTPEGDAFASRYESYLTDPAEQPDQKKWETEVAIKLASIHSA